MTTPAQIHPEEPGAVAMLDQAITALTTALDDMPINEVVNLKAKVATIQTATKELGMSKEAQELATEAVRRSEWALGRAIRKGQAEGTVSRREGNGLQSTGQVESRPSDFATPGELHGGGESKPGILALAAAAETPEQFDAALDEAKAEGNLSRANVARKAREATSSTPAKPRRVPRPEAERTLNTLVMHAEKAAREAKNLSADQVRRIKPKADHWTVDLRNSLEVLQGLLTSLTEEK
jgi:hypothetical protein